MFPHYSNNDKDKSSCSLEPLTQKQKLTDSFLNFSRVAVWIFRSCGGGLAPALLRHSGQTKSCGWCGVKTGLWQRVQAIRKLTKALVLSGGRFKAFSLNPYVSAEAQPPTTNTTNTTTTRHPRSLPVIPPSSSHSQIPRTARDSRRHHHCRRRCCCCYYCSCLRLKVVCPRKGPSLAFPQWVVEGQRGPCCPGLRAGSGSIPPGLKLDRGPPGGWRS